VAGQVYFTNKAITDQLSKMESHQWLDIDYSAFCANPKDYYLEILSRMDTMGVKIDTEYSGPTFFSESSLIDLKTEEIKEVSSHFQSFENENNASV
jgi:hypothetical protein